jgi:hypothetical protein
VVDSTVVLSFVLTALVLAKLDFLATSVNALQHPLLALEVVLFGTATNVCAPPTLLLPPTVTLTPFTITSLAQVVQLFHLAVFWTLVLSLRLFLPLVGLLI